MADAAASAAAAIAGSGPASAAAAGSVAVLSGKGLPLPAHIALPDLDSLGRGPGIERSELAQVATKLASDMPMIEHVSQVMPAADFLFGGAMLLIIVLMHATGLRWLTDRFEQRVQRPQMRQATWQPDMLLAAVVTLMLMLHLFEIFVWAAALVWGGLVRDWRAAGFFAANTYTTVGYGTFVLPNGWHMLAPIIAISGLFTFGWTGSVLVEVVRRCQETKSAVIAARTRHRPPHVDADRAD